MKSMTSRSRLVMYVCVRAFVCVCLCARVCVHVCACVIREIKLPFQDNTVSLYHLYLICALNLISFCHVGLFLFFYVRK